MKISVLTPSIRPEGLKVVQECLERQTMPGTEFEFLTEIGLVRNGYDLSQAFNRMIKRSRGELLVFYQDYIKILDDGLERFWKAYKDHHDTLFTAPVGKVQKWEDSPKWDWRSYKQNDKQTEYTDCRWDTCELDWGAIPRDILFKIGGFDETLDQFWSCDNVNMGCRADLAGYKFKCVFTNPAVAWDHDAHIPNPYRKNYNPAWNTQRMNEFRLGKTINYL